MLQKPQHDDTSDILIHKKVFLGFETVDDLVAQCVEALLCLKLHKQNVKSNQFCQYKKKNTK